MKVSLKIVVFLPLLVLEASSQRFFQSQQESRFPSFNQNQNEKQFKQTEPVRTSGSSLSCPEKNGRFPTRTCDGYIECEDGVPEEKTCPDGLLFNAAAGIYHFPCQYPIDVDCSGRESTQPPQPTEDCPHQYGYFKVGDAVNCGQFKNCAAGRGYVFDCPEGLAFNDETYRCDWPDQVASCDAEAYLGFKCPPTPEARGFTGLGDEEYRYYRSNNDCQRYFICIKGKPRLYNCGEGNAFNDLTNACDGIENVTGCAVPSQSKSQFQPSFTTQQPTQPQLNYRPRSKTFNRGF